MTDIKFPPMPKAHTVVKPKDSEPFGLITTRDALNFAAEAVRLNVQAVPAGWREFIKRVSVQKPEKPDYWSACGQCERNASEAEDLLSAAPAAPQPAQPLDAGVMELAESVGLIGPASRTDDLHEAIQRFHDLIVVNASIKAALHFADGLAQPAQQPLTDEQIKRIMLDNGFTIKEGLTDLKPYVYAAARALIAEATGVKND